MILVGKLEEKKQLGRRRRRCDGSTVILLMVLWTPVVISVLNNFDPTEVPGTFFYIIPEHLDNDLVEKPKYVVFSVTKYKVC